MENFKENFDNIIIEKLSVEKDQITSEANFFDDLGADSLDMVELIMDMENEFKISIPDDVAEQIKTVGDDEKYIMDMLSKAQN